MEPYTDMKYSDCGCSGRCRKVSGNQNQSVRSCLDPAMQGGIGVRHPQMGDQMNNGMTRLMPENGNNWENNGNFGWNRMPGLEGNAFCPGSMPGVLEKDYPLAMAYVPWQQWQTPYGPERGLAQGTIFSELDLAFDKGRCS